MIRFEQVTKRYPDGTTAVDGLSFEVAEGELVTLVGPSGCGKTTTMMMVNRLIEPTSGRIFVGGEDIASVDPVLLRRRIGYVIQQVGLFPHRTILDNTATVPTLVGWKKAKARARAAELLELVGLDPKTYGSRYPDQLSGGQRQRVSLRGVGTRPREVATIYPTMPADPEWTMTSDARSGDEEPRRLREEIDQLKEAVTSHAVVDQAIGMMVALGRVTPEQGWAVLREVSQHTNIKLRNIAELIIIWGQQGDLPSDVRAVFEDTLDKYGPTQIPGPPPPTTP